MTKGSDARLVEVMSRRGVGVRRLASMTGLSLNTIRRLRSRDLTGSAYTWVLVADALEVDVSELLGGKVERTAFQVPDNGE